jgi:CDP-diacylglycerol--serine O-phosphatidyltransferase
MLTNLMVSTHRYLSFKKTRIPPEKRFQVVVGMILLLILLATEPPITLFAVALIYVLSGPLLDLYTFMKSKKSKKGKKGKTLPEKKQLP